MRVAYGIYDRIKASVQSLRQFPERTRIGRVAGTRECVVARLPFMVVVQVEGRNVRVLNVIHTARKFPV